MLKSYRNFMVAFIPHLLMVIFIVICLPILFNTLNATEVQSNQISIVDNRSVAVSRVISATYVGGSGSDWDHQDIMVGHNGDIYITGKTTSSDFPVTTGTYAGDEDAFIVRMSPDLSTIVACTFLGGSNYDMGQKIQIDVSGNVYVAGTTESSDFPTTFGAYQETYQGNNGYWGGDAFIAKLSPDLSTIIAATLLGGSGSEEGNDLILDDNGDLYLSGITGSANFPVISGYDQGYNGGYGNFASDAFLSKFDGNLQTLIASTFLGGVRNENGGYISIDTDRNIFVTGITGSGNFPFTTGAYDSTFSNSIGDVFISKFDQTLSSLMASTFLGGSDTDWGYAVLNDADGNVFVTGHMSSIDYPTTPGAYDRTYNASCGYMQNCADVAISKLNGNLTELLASTYLGGNSWDSGTDLCLGSDGRVYVGGFTHSTEYFPTAGSIYSQDYLGGSADLFVAGFDDNLTTLYHSTYFGGDGADIGTICLNAENDIYFVAVTSSQDIPTSDNAIQPNYAGGEYDVYVAKYTTNLFSHVTNGDIVNDGGKSVAVSWGDYDNDGYDDLFVSNFGYPIPQNNCLYHNQGDGTFSKIAGVSVTNDNTFSAGSCWGDYDNDNDLDIFVGTSQYGLNLLYENNGDGTFTQILNTDIVNDPAYSLNSSWLDYNNNGLLDLIVSNENDNNPPNYTASNFLYRNDDTSFIQQSTGTLVTDMRKSHGVNCTDFDNDGDADIWIVNDLGQNNNLYENLGDGTFNHITSGAIVNDGGSGRGSSWADFDNDGDLDVFVTNVTYNDNANDFLYFNNGDGTFTRDVISEIVNQNITSTGSCAGDFDNDGDLDLFITSNPLNFLWLNNNDGTFIKVASGDIVTDTAWSHGAACSDYDHDGDLDIYVANWSDDNNFLYQNIGNTNNWLNIKCVGIISNKSAIGSKVRLKAVINDSPTWLLREISTQTGCWGQNSLDVHFGLGDATIIDSIKIEWPSGQITDILTDVTPNQFITITETICGDVNEDQDIDILDIVYLINYKYKAGPSVVPEYVADVNSDENIDILDIVHLINFKYKGGPKPDCL